MKNRIEARSYLSTIGCFARARAIGGTMSATVALYLWTASQNWTRSNLGMRMMVPPFARVWWRRTTSPKMWLLRWAKVSCEDLVQGVQDEQREAAENNLRLIKQALHLVQLLADRRDVRMRDLYALWPARGARGIQIGRAHV